MADIEKVIKGLECCYCNFPKTMDCNNCPYDKICYHDKACSLMLRDALELLKEKVPVYPTWKDGKMYCGYCGKRIPSKIGARYCHKCGTPIRLRVNDIC